MKILITLEGAIEKLDCYDWIVFTSVNGVDAFFENLSFYRGDTENAERSNIYPRELSALW